MGEEWENSIRGVDHTRVEDEEDWLSSGADTNGTRSQGQPDRVGAEALSRERYHVASNGQRWDNQVTGRRGEFLGARTRQLSGDEEILGFLKWETYMRTSKTIAARRPCLVVNQYLRSMTILAAPSTSGWCVCVCMNLECEQHQDCERIMKGSVRFPRSATT